MAGALDWRQFRDENAARLLKQTGLDVEGWKIRIDEAAPADEAALDLGEVTVQARKTYVSLLTPRRTFARVQPTTRTRVDVGLRLEVAPEGPLRPGRIHDSMPVQLCLATVEDLDEASVAWLARAYAGSL